MDDAIKKHLSVFSAIPICLCYCYFISSRISKGFFRLISILPILCLFTALPLYLPPVFFSNIAVSFVQWLSIFRLILFAFGQGPLSPPQSLYSFIVSGVFPTIINPSSKTSTKKLKPAVVIGAEVFTLAVSIVILVKYGHDIQPTLRIRTYGCVTVMYMLCMANFTESAFPVLFGIGMEPMFDAPLSSTSLQDFWGRRWNLVVSNMLGQVVHKPVRSASAVFLGKNLSPIPAYMLTFLVSGLMHEFWLYSIARSSPSWEMTAFFVLHGVGMILELYVKKALKGKVSLPWFLSVCLTVGFMFFSSFWLFWPSVIRAGVDTKVSREFQCLKEFLHDVITSLFVWMRH